MLKRSIVGTCLLACIVAACAGRPPLPTKMTDTEPGGIDALAGAGGGAHTDDATDDPLDRPPGPPAEEPTLDDDAPAGPSAPFTPEPTRPGATTSTDDCLAIPAPSHDGHGHAQHRHYTRGEVCEDQGCAQGVVVLACIEATQDDYRTCEGAAVDRRANGARSTLPADLAERARCGGHRAGYVPTRFWRSYYRDHERCLDAYDDRLRSCIGTWPIRARPPRLRPVPPAAPPAR